MPGTTAQQDANRVAEIIRLEAEADKLEADVSNRRWEAARLIAEELATGTSQRELAAQIGKSEMHVRLMRKCWEKRELKFAGDTFNQFYNSAIIRGEPKPPPPKPEPPQPKPPELESGPARTRPKPRRTPPASSTGDRPTCPECGHIISRELHDRIASHA